MALGEQESQRARKATTLELLLSFRALSRGTMKINTERSPFISLFFLIFLIKEQVKRS